MMVPYALTIIIATITGHYTLESKESFKSRTACAAYGDDLTRALGDNSYILSIKTHCAIRKVKGVPDEIYMEGRLK